MIPGQDTSRGCRVSPQSGRVQEAANQCFSPALMFLSLSFSFPSPPSRINKRRTLKKEEEECTELQWSVVDWNSLLEAHILDAATIYASNPHLNQTRGFQCQKWVTVAFF